MTSVLILPSPFVMMSQNRQSAKDRLMAESDYHCNVKGEEEIRHIMEHLDHQDTIILQILQRMEADHKEVVQHLARLILRWREGWEQISRKSARKLLRRKREMAVSVGTDK